MANVTLYRTLSSGQEVATLGLGTWKSKPGELEKAVFHAIKSGYRHLDCASIYYNEDEVGHGIKDALDAEYCKREDLFITSKLWNTCHRRDLVTKSCKASIEKLGISYLDLYLVHWPMAYAEDGETFPKGEDGNIISSTAPNATIMDCWQGMEECVELNLTKNIGLSNFNSQQIEKILKDGKIKPANLQIEAHPYFNNGKLIKFSLDHGISVTAYSPLGSPARTFAKSGEPCILEEEHIKKMADKYGKTPAHVILRWNIQRGIIVVPKSVTRSRIEENLNLFDFELLPDDMETINSFHKDENRLFHLDWVSYHPDFPFHIPF